MSIAGCRDQRSAFANAPHFSRLGRLDEFPNAAVRTCPVERRNRGGLWTGCFWASQLKVKHAEVAAPRGDIRGQMMAAAAMPSQGRAIR